METNYKITIPEPCKENWDKMTPNESGRFCMSCSKTVIDFTILLPDEVQHFFIQNQNKSLCGRFKNEQLENLIIQIPSRVLYTQTQYHKMFLLALFIAMGTTLFSCSDKNGNKQKIDKVEVVDNTVQDQDESETVSSCYGHQIESKKKKMGKPAYQFTMGLVIPANTIETGSFKYHVIYNSTDLDVLPVPESGMNKFYDFFAKNYLAPKKTEKFKGKIFILFVVEEDGSLSNFNIIKNTPAAIGEEAIRVLKAAPNWIPGKRNNAIVRSSHTLSIAINNDHDVQPPTKVDQVKFVKPKENDILKSEKTNNKENSVAKVAVHATATGEVVSETNAEFPGGIEQFYKFFGKEFKMPEAINTKNLKINLSFAIEKNGSVSYLQSVPAIDNAIEQEIIRVLSACPKWLPGEINGKKVKRQYSLPIVLQ